MGNPNSQVEGRMSETWPVAMAMAQMVKVKVADW